MQERDLCANNRFLPSFYLSLKAAFLREAAQRPQRAIPRSDARNLFRLEPAKSLKVYELLQRAGWLPTAPQKVRGTTTAPHSEAASPLGAPALGPGLPTPQQSLQDGLGTTLQGGDDPGMNGVSHGDEAADAAA